MSITVVGPQEAPAKSEFPFFVNTTSRSGDFGVGFSPFLNGPVGLWLGAPAETSLNIENAWQFSKVYDEHIGPDGMPNEEWYRWARIGFQTKKAIRYPKGKTDKPKFAFWDGKKLDYIAARKEIYIPIYKDCIRPSKAFKQLCDVYKKYKKVILWGFDGYNRKLLGMTPDDVVNYYSKSLCHAFVVEQLLLEHFNGELEP